MKKSALCFLVCGFIILGFSGCLKGDSSCTDKTPASEQPQILAYASGNGISATPHSSGLYYQVITQGSGAAPTATSKVTVNYTGKLTDGTVFDQSTAPVTFPLGNVISGWQIGLPLIQKGGVIKLIIPSALAYGCAGYGGIPGNSVLYFEISLIDVQ